MSSGRIEGFGGGRQTGQGHGLGLADGKQAGDDGAKPQLRDGATKSLSATSSAIVLLCGQGMLNPSLSLSFRAGALRNALTHSRLAIPSAPSMDSSCFPSLTTLLERRIPLNSRAFLSTGYQVFVAPGPRTSCPRRRYRELEGNEGINLLSSRR